MKVLVLIRKSFTNVGIKPVCTSQKSRFNETNSAFLFALFLRFCSTSLFFLIEADTFELYINSGLLVAADFISIMIFLNMIRESPNLYQFFDSLEVTIHESKCP